MTEFMVFDCEIHAYSNGADKYLNKLHELEIGRLVDKYGPKFYATIPHALVTGEIKYREEVTRGLDTVGDAILRVQEGKNRGKAVVVVAEK
ncbi:hypothetical protein C8R44DRAFT_887913 [Mycena epipterygia]|nr:hypothetical protein C8R44DRAFT_887913 [Mycena epipterygia]